MFTEFWRGNLKERTKSEDQGVIGTLVLMWSRLCWHWLDWSWLKVDVVMSICSYKPFQAV